MEERIANIIASYVKEYQLNNRTGTDWRTPLVSFADVEDSLFGRLKEIVSPTHALPRDFLPDARSIIAYFIPFSEEVVNSNIQGTNCSKAWAEAYIETNQLISDLNEFLCKNLRAEGYQAVNIPATHNFDQERLISDWSHRHVAFIAGLGKFGLNNMLITDQGCAGRVGTLVTNLKLVPTPRKEEEYCLYKRDKSCTRCVENCAAGALREDLFDRQRCYKMCLANDRLFTDLGLADVCGKCVVDLPCSLKRPKG